MPSQHVVEYDRLVAEYEDSLLSMLRGFRTGPEFLEAWVPNDDHVEAILTILDAASEARLASVSVRVDAGTLDEEEAGRLRQDLAHYGEVTVEAVGQQTAYHVTLVADGGRPTAGTARARDGGSTPAPAPAGKTRSPAGKRVGISPAGGSEGSAYVARLVAIGGTESRSGSLAAAPPGCVRVEYRTEGVELSAWVDSDAHRVRGARYCGDLSEAVSRMLDLLCVILEGRPVQEGSDHAVSRLEYQLRGSAAPVPGIVTPAAADPIFELALRLVRGLALAYHESSGCERQESAYHEEASRRWSEMAAAGRVDLVRSEIASFSSEVTAELLELDDGNRAFLELDDTHSDWQQQTYLMDLEEHLQGAVEPTLQLFLRPRDDRNKLRRLGVKR